MRGGCTSSWARGREDGLLVSVRPGHSNGVTLRREAAAPISRAAKRVIGHGRPSAGATIASANFVRYAAPRKLDVALVALGCPAGVVLLGGGAQGGDRDVRGGAVVVQYSWTSIAVSGSDGADAGRSAWLAQGRRE